MEKDIEGCREEGRREDRPIKSSQLEYVDMQCFFPSRNFFLKIHLQIIEKNMEK